MPDGKHLLRRVAIASFLLVTGCAAPSAIRPAGSEPRLVLASAAAPRVALVLSGGAARGYAHVGVIKVLERHGLRPHLVVGTSAGSIVGALYASGLAIPELERAVAELDATVFTDVSLPALGLFRGSLGIVRGDKLHRFVDERARRHEIGEFPIPFAAVATDLSTGDAQIFNAGDAGLAVRASSAVPGIIAPATIGGRLFSDGQLSSPLPVAAARRLGARRVIAVDVIYPPSDASVTTAVGVLFQAFTIATYRLKSAEASGADLLIAPALGGTSSQLSFRDRERLIAAGERAAEQALPRIREIFAADRPGP